MADDVRAIAHTVISRSSECSAWCGRSMVDWLRRHGLACLHATAMSPPNVEQVLAAFSLIQGRDGTTRGLGKIRSLQDNAAYFREQLQAMVCIVLGTGSSPVVVRHSSLSKPFQQCFEVAETLEWSLAAREAVVTACTMACSRPIGCPYCGRSTRIDGDMNECVLSLSVIRQSLELEQVLTFGSARVGYRFIV